GRALVRRGDSFASASRRRRRPRRGGVRAAERAQEGAQAATQRLGRTRTCSVDEIELRRRGLVLRQVRLGGRRSQPLAEGARVGGGRGCQGGPGRRGEKRLPTPDQNRA